MKKEGKKEGRKRKEEKGRGGEVKRRNPFEVREGRAGVQTAMGPPGAPALGLTLQCHHPKLVN